MTVTRIVNWTPTIPVTVHTFRRSELGGDHTMGEGEGAGLRTHSAQPCMGLKGVRLESGMGLEEPPAQGWQRIQDFQF